MTDKRGENYMFNEDTLRKEIERIWGQYGAHAEVFGMMEERTRRLERERDALRVIVNRYMAAYPAFRMKPIGAPGSPARIEQENMMALEEAAKAALTNPKGER